MLIDVFVLGLDRELKNGVTAVGHPSLWAVDYDARNDCSIHSPPRLSFLETANCEGPSFVQFTQESTKRGPSPHFDCGFGYFKFDPSESQVGSVLIGSSTWSGAST